MITLDRDDVDICEDCISKLADEEISLNADGLSKVYKETIINGLKERIKKTDEQAEDEGSATTDRLTRRLANGRAVCAYCGGEYDDLGKCSNRCELRGQQLERLAEYEDAEEQGRLVVLLVEVGGVAYWCTPDLDGKPFVGSFMVHGVVIKDDGFYLIDSDKSMDKVGTQYAMLTREEAEAALQATESE